MKRRLLLLGLVVLVFAAATSLRAQTDPRIGTWKLNLSKSTASNGDLPKSDTRTYEAQGDQIMASSEGVDAQGKSSSAHYNATADGKDHPLGGPDPSITVGIKQTGPGAYAGTIKKDGKVIATNTAIISGGGKVFTFKSKGTDASGKPITSTVVYDKQ